ncbi:MAG: nucleotide exchange factor GrpE [Planctomycetes bacterium]|nr:nucleotide exchange factor GrpE [Planctomycetota bacterium]
MNDSNPNSQEPDETQPDGREPVVEIPPHEQEMVRLREERDHFETQLQRALADTANIRRRQKQEMDDSRRRVLEGLTQELLPVLDSFSMALTAYDTQGANADPKALVDGVRLVRTLLSSALERHGLSEIAAEGLAFDPARMEAVAVEPSAAVPEGHVVRVLQAGYLLGEHVVRHSKVTVAGPAKNDTKD